MLRLVYSCTWCDWCRGTQGSWALWALTFYNPISVYRYESDDTWRHEPVVSCATLVGDPASYALVTSAEYQ